MSTPISSELVQRTMEELHIKEIGKATIRQMVGLSQSIEQKTGQRFIHFEMGSPGLPACQIGIDAEKRALDSGVASIYPNIAGIPQIKNAASRFVKAFLDIDISPEGCIPTVGSMMGSYSMFLATVQSRLPERDTVLFINPGFPVQPLQVKIMGFQQESFDVYDYRGDKLREKLVSYLKTGRIASIIYSNPNNPAWICLNDDELRTIGELATEYDVVVIEDLAYMGMDSRRDLGKPFEAPYQVTVAKYTDNYVLLMSGSKIFSYAGQRIAVVAISDKLFAREFEGFRSRYGMARFGQAYIQTILYAFSSGVCHSAQHALAAMMDAAADGTFNFVEATSEYARRTKRLKDIFLRNGFHIVYDKDNDEPLSDGFFFTIGYKGYTGNGLLRELLNYGVCAIALGTTGSEQEGLRACSSAVKEGDYELLDERLAIFKQNNPL